VRGNKKNGLGDSSDQEEVRVPWCADSSDREDRLGDDANPDAGALAALELLIEVLEGK
jgi:hypothetical protein